jgi:large subunit ribosomal protein L25
MKKEAIKIQTAVRTKHGSRYSQRLRAEGRLPGVVYGHKQDPVSVDFDAKELLGHVRGGQKVFTLNMAGGKAEGQMALIRDVQFDYLGNNPVHVDFARVDANERVHTKVHIELKGDAKGLKTAGAILIHPFSEIEIECRVIDLPEFIEVDISDLDMDQQITAGQVKLPAADMKLITDTHSVVAQIVEAKEEVVAEAAAVDATATAGPEVIGEKERLEKAAAEAAGKPGAKPAAAGAKPAAGAPAAKAAAPAAKK